jgi:hypothetical protein
MFSFVFDAPSGVRILPLVVFRPLILRGGLFMGSIIIKASYRQLNIITKKAEKQGQKSNFGGVETRKDEKPFCHIVLRIRESGNQSQPAKTLFKAYWLMESFCLPSNSQVS